MREQHEIGIIGAAPARPAPRVDDPEWTKEVVLDRLAEGIKIIQRVSGRVGPRAYGNAMPTFLAHLDEELRGWTAPEPFRIPPSARQIRLAEEACDWPVRYVEDRRVREALHIWMAAKAFRRPWQKLAERRGWAKETAKRYRERAIYLIVTGLEASGAVVEAVR